MAKGKWTKLATILRKKDGVGKYLKVNANVKLTEGQILSMFNPRERKGITEEQLAKIPDFVLAEVFLPPEND